MASSEVKVYTVNGAAAGSSSSLPDWLTRKRAAKGKGKRAIREHVEGSIELIQGFEFPEASNRVKTTRDGHHVIATGTYKPQMRVWDLDQLSLKFERHSDSENVDFTILSDDWTKIIQLQNDRTIELHTQGGLHYKTRIPRFGRCLAYHFPSCDALFGTGGNEVFRLNLDQGRFMTPLQLPGDVLGINAIDINPAHQLWSFGADGGGSVHFWDPRSRSEVGVLKLPLSRILPIATDEVSATVSVTAISSKADGLSYAVGTSTGHTLLYDIRAARPFSIKDQGYGLPIKNVHWLQGGSKLTGDGLILSADKKVIKIWGRDSPGSNFVSITPANDLNDVHHVPGSGLLLTANEGIQMTTLFIPQLGPAPRWASFLENITEEMEDQTTRTVYEDYKFVERKELTSLGLDHLIGTPALKPYMHGYFLSLKLYDTARVIANPFAYAEHRERQIKEKIEKMAETRIRAPKGSEGVKVNRALAEKLRREEERELARLEKKKAKKLAVVADSEEDAMAVDAQESAREKPSLLADPRFSKLFEDPEYTIDENTREYALLNPSNVVQRANGAQAKTAVEEEAEESDRLSQSNEEDSSGNENDSEDEPDSDDSSDAGDLNAFDPRAHPGQKNARAQEAYLRQQQRNRLAKIDYAPVRVRSSQGGGGSDAAASFGSRMRTASSRGAVPTAPKRSVSDNVPTEISWVPSGRSGNGDDDLLGGDGQKKNRNKSKARGVEMFGAGMEKGFRDNKPQLDEAERRGRTQRRQGMRSGSKNTFRRM